MPEQCSSEFSDLSRQEFVGGCSVWSFTVDPMIIWPLSDFLSIKIVSLVWGDILRDPVSVFLVLSKPLQVVLAKVPRSEKTKLYPESSSHSQDEPMPFSG